MNFSSPFIRRPVMTTLVMLGILCFGLLAYRVLPVSDLPSVDFPTISVSASLPGANPETMAASVATPLEKQFTTIAGLESMTSSSSQGNTSITLQFRLDRDIDAAAQDVQSAISAAQRLLPQGMPSPPSLRKVNPADQPVIYLALASPTLPLSKVNEFAETLVAQRISTVSGVAQVQVFGSQKFAVRVQVDPNLLASRGIGMDEVAEAIRENNVNLPTGTLSGSEQNLTLKATGQLEDAEAYRKLIVTYRDGAPVYLEQIGTVLDSVQNNKIASWFRDTRAIVLAVQRQPGANTIEVVDRIRAMIPRFQNELPAAVSLNILNDRSMTIRESVHDVKLSLLLAIILVVFVIFVFLRTVSATLIASVSMPMSVIGTFAIMYLLDFSIDNFSLMALTLSVGFVVDDAIVVLENIVRHMEKGESMLEAALRGSKEIGFTVISMTLSLVAVFLPVLFMEGILGRLLFEFSVTIGVAILVSGFISLTLIPMLCSRFLGEARHEHHRGAFYRVTEKGFDLLRSVYERTLRIALRHRVMILFSGLLMVAGTAWLFIKLPKGFIPTEDTGMIFAFTEARQDISFESMRRHQQAAAEVLLENPHIESFMSSIGAGGPNATANTGRFIIRLKPRSQRPHAEKIIQELRPKLAKITGIKVFPQIPPSIRIGGQVSKSQYQFTMYSTDLETLYAKTPVMEEKLRAVPGLLDVVSDLQVNNPEIMVHIDREKASALGVSAEQVERTLNYAYGSSQVSTIYTSTDQYWVILEVTPEHQSDPDSLGRLYVRSSRGILIPLSTIADIRPNVGPLTVTHLGQLPSVTLSFNLSPGTSLGDAVNKISAIARQELPATISTSFQGTAQAFQDSLQGLGVLLIMAVLIIYLVLGILYESFIHPLTILSGLPAASFGALVTLWIFGYELNLYGFVGMLMLIGIVKKNAIMMIDFAIDAQKNDKQSPDAAIFEACLVRFRPIMMTTVAAIIGTSPIALGIGAGADVRRPLGLSVIGGLIVSQLLTLYLTPVLYIYLDRMQSRFQKRRSDPPKPVRSEALSEV